MAKRIVLSTKKAMVVGGGSRPQLFLQKNHKFSNLPEDVVKLYIRKAREPFRTRTVEAI